MSLSASPCSPSSTSELAHPLDVVAEFGDQQFGGVGVDGLGNRRHHPHTHQRLDHVGAALRHAVRQLLHGDRFRDDNIADHLVYLRPHRLHLLQPFLLASTTHRCQAADALAAVVERLRQRQLAAARGRVGGGPRRSRHTAVAVRPQRAPGATASVGIVFLGLRGRRLGCFRGRLPRRIPPRRDRRCRAGRLDVLIRFAGIDGRSFSGCRRGLAVLRAGNPGIHRLAAGGGRFLRRQRPGQFGGLRDRLGFGRLRFRRLQQGLFRGDLALPRHRRRPIALGFLRILQGTYPRRFFVRRQTGGRALAHHLDARAAAETARTTGITLAARLGIGATSPGILLKCPLLAHLDGDHLRSPVRETLANLSGFDSLLQFQLARSADVASLVRFALVDFGHLCPVERVVVSECPPAASPAERTPPRRAASAASFPARRPRPMSPWTTWSRPTA